jgi:hypothetical protein
MSRDFEDRLNVAEPCVVSVGNDVHTQRSSVMMAASEMQWFKQILLFLIKHLTISLKCITISLVKTQKVLGFFFVLRRSHL